LSLNRLIVLAIICGFVAVAAPRYAPALLQLRVGPSAERADDPQPENEPRYVRPEIQQVKVVRVPAASPEPPPAYGRRVALSADSRGHYQVDASINGRAVEALVDTGATTVALTAESARRIGIYLTRSDFTMQISTANGTVVAAPVTLSQVRVGAIMVRNVPAVVMPGNMLSTNLLGMSFLSRLAKFEVAHGELVLTQ
jgi:aspartyl protease family protein